MANKARLIPAKMLSSDERVIFETRPSAWLYMKAASLAEIIGLISLIIFLWKWFPDAPSIPYLSDFLDGDYGTYVQYVFGALFVICDIFFMYRWMKWGSTVYAATDERIITQKGIFNKTYEDIPVTMITNIDLAQSLGKRALGYGTIVFSTQGMSGGRKADIVWEAVPNPFDVRRKIQEVMDVRVKPKG
ncbi:MAG: hypothetical protein A3K60_03890 [Euryarchaeota archaeon RBG_19FT_COMBO_56_21]|nr:MAG: hypothetical protein A3K60_03890 [Euryarchaeota archaeon RBG_19FT_COMBO_56_21]